jgi:hypothetical protein
MIAETVYLDVKLKPRVRELVYKLPGILIGTITTNEAQTIREGFRIRIGQSILDSVHQNLQLMSEGREGEGNVTWQPLTAKYVVYKRLPIGNFPGLTAPGGPPELAFRRRGLVNGAQLRTWKNLFREGMYSYESGRSVISDLSTREAKRIVAGKAWKDIKKYSGAKSMIEELRNIQVPMMKRTGAGFRSLEPATLIEYGVRAMYTRKPDQIFETDGNRVSVGTSVGYMVRHHTGMLRSGIQRRLWPETFPAIWLSRALERGLEGLVKIHQLFG